MTILYRDDKGISPEDVSNVFRGSGIKRPYEDLPRLAKMIEGADLVITAWDGGKMVGLARALTDYYPKGGFERTDKAFVIARKK